MSKLKINIIFFIDDYNRVVLEMEEGVPDSDYINASYVDVSFCLAQKVPTTNSMLSHFF